jgi:PAS domain S-box-containing protein
MTPDKPNATDALRERAEALLNKAPESFQPADIQSVNALAHELAVHQAELELQNEELRNSQAALQRSRDRFAALFDHAPVGYVVLDPSGLIRQTNATWRRMLGRPNEEFRGKAFAETLFEEDAPVFLSRFRAFFRNPASKEILVRIKRSGAPPFHARIGAQPLATEPGRGVGEDAPSELMVIVSDISDLQRAWQEIETYNANLTDMNRELKSKNAKLQEAYEKIRLLSGIVPICAHCRKIRDDEGYWSQLETFLTKHSETLFSHSICPDCMKEHYPDEFEEM